MQFPAESVAASKFELLHTFATYAMICTNATTDLWRSPRVGSGGPALIQIATQQLTGQLLSENLSMRRTVGAPPSMQAYGQTLYAAEDAVPALYEKFRCVLQVLMFLIELRSLLTCIAIVTLQSKRAVTRFECCHRQYVSILPLQVASLDGPFFQAPPTEPCRARSRPAPDCSAASCQLEH